MAIDRNRLKFLIGDIDELFASFSAPLPETAPRLDPDGGDGAGVRRVARIHRRKPAAGAVPGRPQRPRQILRNQRPGGQEDRGDRSCTAHHATKRWLT